MSKNNFVVTDLQYFKGCYPETVLFIEKYHNGKITAVMFDPERLMYYMLFDRIDETYLGVHNLKMIESKKFSYEELSINYKDYLRLIRNEN
jgi:hypothetical protein